MSDDAQAHLDKLLEAKVRAILNRRTARITENDRDEKTMQKLTEVFGTAPILRCIERYLVEAEDAAAGLRSGDSQTKVGWGQLKLALGEDVFRRITSEN